MVKRGLEFFYFEIQRVPSEIVDVLPSQFSHSGQIFFHRAAATLKGLAESKKKSRLLFTTTYKSKVF